MILLFDVTEVLLFSLSYMQFFASLILILFLLPALDILLFLLLGKILKSFGDTMSPCRSSLDFYFIYSFMLFYRPEKPQRR